MKKKVYVSVIERQSQGGEDRMVHTLPGGTRVVATNSKTYLKSLKRAGKTLISGDAGRRREPA